MTETCVPFARTSIDMKTYARALVGAWRALLGSDPTKGQAGVLWAQYGIETGAGPFCWNWNIGNVKHVTGDGHEYFMLPNTWEMEHGKRVVYQPPHPATWFRSFPDLDTAMVEHFAFLHGKRYAPAWEGVELEDCGLFARLLRQGGYFTATAEAYAAGMRVHFGAWMRASAFEEALAELDAPSVVTPEQLEPEAPIVFALPDPPERE